MVTYDDVVNQEIPDVLYPDCGYFNEEQDEEGAPSACIDCYKYEVCKKCFIKERSVTDNGGGDGQGR